MTNLNNKKLLNELKELKRVLSHINHFSAQQNQYFTEKNQKIDVRININNKKSKEYLEKKSTIPELPQNDLLDILSENTQIHHLKFVMVQEFIEDIYNRIEHIGQSINKSLSPLIDYLESQEETLNG